MLCAPECSKKPNEAQSRRWPHSNQGPILKTETTVGMLNRRDLIQGVCQNAGKANLPRLPLLRELDPQGQVGGAVTQPVLRAGGSRRH